MASVLKGSGVEVRATTSKAAASSPFSMLPRQWLHRAALVNLSTVCFALVLLLFDLAMLFSFFFHSYIPCPSMLPNPAPLLLSLLSQHFICLLDGFTFAALVMLAPSPIHSHLPPKPKPDHETTISGSDATIEEAVPGVEAHGTAEKTNFSDDDKSGHGSDGSHGTTEDSIMHAEAAATHVFDDESHGLEEIIKSACHLLDADDFRAHRVKKIERIGWRGYGVKKLKRVKKFFRRIH